MNLGKLEANKWLKQKLADFRRMNGTVIEPCLSCHIPPPLLHQITFNSFFDVSGAEHPAASGDQKWQATVTASDPKYWDIAKEPPTGVGHGFAGRSGDQGRGVYSFLHPSVSGSAQT